MIDSSSRQLTSSKKKFSNPRKVKLKLLTNMKTAFSKTRVDGNIYSSRMNRG